MTVTVKKWSRSFTECGCVRLQEVPAISILTGYLVFWISDRLLGSGHLSWVVTSRGSIVRH